MDKVIPITFAFLCVIWTLIRTPHHNERGDAEDRVDKLREYLILDIRATNQYSAVFIALMGVMGTIVAQHQADFVKVLNERNLWPFGVAMLAGALSTLFIPAGYGSDSFPRLRLIWLRSVICEQLVVIFVCYGIVNAFCILTNHEIKLF